jgi:hypothetical protein
MTTTQDPVGDAADRSIGQLLSDRSAQTSRLVRDEMRPAQQGFQQSAKRAGIGGGLIGIAGLLLIFAFAAAVVIRRRRRHHPGPTRVGAKVGGVETVPRGNTSDHAR